jgi:ribosomal protein S18 acetylase RimI-like enzyme
MTVREATEDDLGAITRIAEQSWTVDYPDILTRETVEEAVNEWYAADRVAEEFEADQTLLLIAERDESVVGFAHATWNDAEREGYILRIYVHPDHRRKDVGRELLEETRTELSEKGVDRINAMVLAENDPGNAFYERFGFDRVDESETTIGGETYLENRYVLEQ